MIKTPAILSLLSLGLLCATGAHAGEGSSCCATMASGKSAATSMTMAADKDASTCPAKPTMKDASSCASMAAGKDITIPASEIIPDTILTREAQSQLTPDAVLSILMDGNKEYIADNLTVRNNTQRVRDAALGQYPMAVVLSCLDSRVPVEDVFHRGIGDLFVARVAGNIVNEDILGSMEFACKVSGSKLIVVLGHEHCGAIRSAIQGVELGNITALLSKIQPAVQEAKSSFKGDASASNPKFVQTVCDDNVLLAVQQIRDQSPILKQMEDDGEIKIVGGIYHLESGQVELLD